MTIVALLDDRLVDVCRMTVSEPLSVLLIFLLTHSTIGFTTRIIRITDRAVVGQPFTFMFIRQHTASFTETVSFRNGSKPSPTLIFQISLTSSSACRNSHTDFYWTCNHYSSDFTFEVNVTKRVINIYDRWTWNLFFHSDSSQENFDIGIIYSYRMVLSRPETIKESSKISLKCEVFPNPGLHNVTVYKLRQYWGEEFIQERGAREGNVVTLNLDWVSYQDGGRYECTASTGERDSDGNINQTVTKDVIVQAAPRADISHVTVSAERGSNIVLTATFLNTSTTAVQWSRQGLVDTRQEPGLETQNRQYQVYDKNATSRGIVTRLHISVDDGSFGRYDVTSCSDGGCAATSILLTEKSPIKPPQTPVDFRVEANTTRGVLLSWKSGQDDHQTGKQKETFYLTFRRSDMKNSSWNYRLIENSCPGLSVYYLLQNLFPNTGYDVRVQTRIILEGQAYQSPFTDLIYIYMNESTPVSNDSHVLGVGIGIGVGIGTGVTGIGLVVAFVIIMVKRRRENCPRMNNRDETNEIRSDSAE